MRSRHPAGAAGARGRRGEAAGVVATTGADAYCHKNMQAAQGEAVEAGWRHGERKSERNTAKAGVHLLRERSNQGGRTNKHETQGADAVSTLAAATVDKAEPNLLGSGRAESSTRRRRCRCRCR